MSIETQRAPSPSVGSTKSANRSRVYESDPEIEDARVGKLGQPDEATGPAIPPHIMGRAWRVGAGKGLVPPPKPRAPFDPPPPAPTKKELGGGAEYVFAGEKKQ